MPRKPTFINKELFEKSVNYLGQPPCFSCLVRMMCFSTTEKYGRQFFEVHLEQPCEQAHEWLAYAEFFSGLVNHLETINSPLLSLGANGIRAEIRKIFATFTPDPDKIMKHWFD